MSELERAKRDHIEKAWGIIDRELEKSPVSDVVEAMVTILVNLDARLYALEADKEDVRGHSET